MHLRSLTLRNYRVYKAVDLEFPDGLIGIYGPNGAGKSTLIEAVRYCLYGDARTDKWELRSAGVGEDVRVELAFEHEGNSYEVRRRLKGRNLTPDVEVYCNGQLAVQSVREANAYLGRVVGMDQRAFLASVCAQQKELTAFATMMPAERRKLVLDLLGVSPIEKALAKVREEARDAKTAAGAARAQLPDLDAAERAAAAATTAAEHAAACAEHAAAEAAAAQEVLEGAQAALKEADAVARRAVDLLQQANLARVEAAGHRREAERHEQRAQEADALHPQLVTAQAQVAELEHAAAPLAAQEAAREAELHRNALLRGLKDAESREETARRAHHEAEQQATAGGGVVAARVAAEAAVEALEQELADAREHHAAASEALGAATARLRAAEAAVENAAELDPDAPCPTCGQPLGPAHAEVARAHQRELADARAAHQRASAERDAVTEAGKALAARREALQQELKAAREAEQRAARAVILAEQAERAMRVAAEEVAARSAELAASPDPGFDPGAYTAAKQAAEALQQARLGLGELRGRAERADAERALAKEALARADQADSQAAKLDQELAAPALAGAEQGLAAARAAAEAATEAARHTHGEQQRTAEALAGAWRLAEQRSAELAAARARHDEVAALEEDSIYLARLVDLVAGFRLHLVSRLGRRLSVEAAALFAELTDHEYQDLVVDPEDYSVRIADNGTDYELARFSGSENDLASLSLRVAVSLVIAEGAGELGLLVLDEVLGSLDRERRERMLSALTTLQGRFRQVLLVTHNDEVKDMLPAAIEVRKGPHRTSTATVLA
jgi:exonuclease SbcC